MRMLLLIGVVLSAGILFIIPLETFAHGTDHHGGHADEQMKKLHAMMPMFSIASAELESALEKGDAASAKIKAEMILAAVPDLKKSKPHKNIKHRKEFVELAIELEKSVNSSVYFIKEDNFSGAKTAFKKVEDTCAACHAKFRD